MHLPRSPRRRHTAWTTASLSTAAVLLATSLAGFAAPAGAEPPSGAGSHAEVDPLLEKTVGNGGEATFFVVLRDKADLGAARQASSPAAKARGAYSALRSTAARGQKSLTEFLDREKVGHEDFWITNSVKVTGDEELVATLAKRPDVARLVQERHYPLATPQESDTVDAATATTAALEWGITEVKADQVWAQHGTRGEGVVIANIDSGVQFDHPALVGSYRGNDGDGSFTHDYNFFDASGQCTPGTPCDNNGHGTHVMGTMAGAEGLGVAPGATWIAAKGCETRSCSDTSLLSAGQWILAPTDRNGQNPRPELAPNIVNNSWGGGHTTFYQDTVRAWNAAGIFEAFAAGNDGNGVRCSTANAPGSQAPVYAVGAYDVNGRIATFSGFGPSLVDGSMVPDIAAPGVNVRSAWPGSNYNTISGTSMATPHVTGAVALLWSVAPSLIGDIAATRAALGGSAIDVADTHCGGTADANNVWGEGKLDILASADAAPKAAAMVSGTVTDVATGQPLPDITVEMTDGTETRTVRTGSKGGYRIHLSPGTYDFTLSGYGYDTKTVATVTVTDQQVLNQDIALTATPAHPVGGTVLDVTGKPLTGATVAIAGTPLAPVTTGPDGTFAFPRVAEGGYGVVVTPAAPVLCNGVLRLPLVVDSAETTTLRLPARTDAFGNSCSPTAYSWVRGKDTVPLSGDEDTETIALPFPVSFYGVSYEQASITTNGLIHFLSPRIGDYTNATMPTAGGPNGFLAALWDDFTLDRKSRVQTATTGSAGKRTFAVAWTNVLHADGSGNRSTFEAVFHESDGDITLQFQSVPGGGSSATVGMENQAGNDALEYSHNQPVLSNGSAIRIAQGVS